MGLLQEKSHFLKFYLSQIYTTFLPPKFLFFPELLKADLIRRLAFQPIWCVCMLSHANSCDSMDYSPPGSTAHGAESWSKLPFPPPGTLSNPGIKPASPTLGSGFLTTLPLGTQPICDGHYISYLLMLGKLVPPFQSFLISTFIYLAVSSLSCSTWALHYGSHTSL